MFSVLAIVTLCLLGSCEKELNVQQHFPFEVKVMPVPKGIAQGSTVEIRCQIQTESQYTENQYFIRYFQFDGQGCLKIASPTATALLPNDLYVLPNKTFRLYYTSHSEVSEMFAIWISDSFGSEQKVEFEFNNISKTP